MKISTGFKRGALLAIGLLCGGSLVLMLGVWRSHLRSQRCVPVVGSSALSGLDEWLPSGRRRLFFNGAISGSHYSIGVLEASESPQSAVEPILRGSPGSWDEDIVKDPYAVEDDGRILLFYSGYSARTGAWGVGLAISRNSGQSWEKRADPVIEPFHARVTHPFPVVVHRPNDWPRWVMLYSRVDGIYVATSADGVDWQSGAEPVLRNTDNVWGKNALTPGDVRFRSGQWNLFYGGLTGRTWSMGIATSDELLGPYEPSLTPLEHDTPRLYTLLAGSKAGQTSVDVTPAIEAGPFVAIVYDDRGWQIVHVLGIGNHGSVSLAEPLKKRYKPGSTLVSVVASSVTPEFVFDSAGKTYLLATAFQMVPGCLIELGLLGRLSDTGGTPSVAWEWPSIPVVPLGFDGRWNSNSAENATLVRPAENWR